MVIPIHDDNPVRRVPIVTYLLIALNFVVFFTEPVVSQIGVGSQSVAAVCEQRAYFDKWAVVPKELIHNDQLSRVPTGDAGFNQLGQPGCVVGPPTYDKKPWLSVLFAMFMHGGWLHILGNMLFLYVFGNNIEDRMGRLKFLLFYVFCGYVASYGFAFGNSDSITTLIGASGAIAGVLGAYVVVFPRARVTTVIPLGFFFIPLKLPAWGVLGGWFLLQWLYSSGSAVASGAGVAYLAHVFGFIAGAATAIIAKPFLNGTRVTSVR